jgi:hypothetical protein
VVDVHQPVRSGAPSLAYFAKGGIPRTTPSGDLIFPVHEHARRNSCFLLVTRFLVLRLLRNSPRGQAG